MTPPDQQTHLIVGGGLAGAKAAEALRAEGFEGRIVLVANVAHPFYGGRLRVEPGQRAPPARGRRALHARQARRRDRLPYFFSDRYDVGMEHSGLGSGADEVLVRGDRDAREPSPSGFATTASWPP